MKKLILIAVILLSFKSYSQTKPHSTTCWYDTVAVKPAYVPPATYVSKPNTFRMEFGIRKYYEIDWDKVQTWQQLKFVLSNVRLFFTDDNPNFKRIKHLVKIAK